MNFVASYIEYYLPVFIPLFLTIISVLAGIVTKRIEVTLGSVLKIHSDIIIGLFSFVIWALVAYQQSGAIKLNQNFELSLIRVVLLLFANIILLISGQIVLSIKWSERIGFLQQSPNRADNIVNGFFLLITVIFIFAPIFLKSPVSAIQKTGESAEKIFAVAIPYSDSSLAKHVGLGRWGNRRLCDVVSIAAVDKDKATEKAISDFINSGRAVQVYGDSSIVDIDKLHIVADHR